MKRRSFIKALTGIAAIPAIIKAEPKKEAVKKPFEYNTFPQAHGRLIIGDKWTFANLFVQIGNQGRMETYFIGDGVDGVTIYDAWHDSDMVTFIQRDGTEHECYITAITLRDGPIICASIDLHIMRSVKF